MRRRRLLAASFAAVIASSACHGEPAQPSPIPASIFSPAPLENLGCPVGRIHGVAISAEDSMQAMHGLLPRLLPVGFGVVTAWRPSRRQPDAGVAWAAAGCRTIVLRLSRPSDAPPSGPQVGGWSLVRRAMCGNGPLRGVPCLTYRARTDEGVLSLATVGLSTEESDAVAVSFRL